MPDIPVITDSATLSLFAGQLQREKVIAVDLEADSMHCYREKVCLLQISTPDRTVLVDPLAEVNIDPLRGVLADPAIRKIFHAADYDIRCLHRDFGIEIAGLFDTMVASQFTGEDKVGLADVLGKYFGVELDKQYQRADWALRPLSEEMIAYAAEDTRHLHRLAALLEERLAALGRVSWVAEEFTLLERVRFDPPVGPLFLRIKGAGRLERRQLAVLEELLQWREEEARRRDKPPFKVIGNKALLEIAAHRLRSRQGLLGLEGVFPRLVDRYGKALLAAVAAGCALPEERLPVFPRTERPRRDPAAEKRLASLKEWRRNKAEELSIEPGILINNNLLVELSRDRPRNEKDLVEIAGMKTWQREVLGDDILRLLETG